MNLHFDEVLGIGYKSKSQKIRVMSESWVCNNLFCPCCGNPQILGLKNNVPVADMRCNNCGEIFELKSKEGKIGEKIIDGAYLTMIERITGMNNPGLLVMQYSSNYDITDLMLIPKFFFIPQVIEKRKPLASTAKRAGWTGCNILFSAIPQQGKISIINNGIIRSQNEVVENYKWIRRLKTEHLDSRGWLFDVLNCINNIDSNDFTLHEMYSYVEELQQKHVDNHNIEAKIRQQLQFLRDRGFIEFLGRGHYRKLL